MQKVSQIIKLLATGGGLGYARKAPGTVGTFGALVISLLLLNMVIDPFINYIHFFLAVISYAVGIFVIEKVTPIWGDDPSKVVIDEFCGFWLAITLIPASINYYILAFVLFRFFDITKIMGIAYFDRKKTAHGVMLDDVIAGLYTALVLFLAYYWDIIPN